MFSIFAGRSKTTLARRFSKGRAEAYFLYVRV